MLYCSSAYLELESATGELGSFTGVFILNYIYTQGALQHPTSNWCNHSTANELDIIISSHSSDSAEEVSYSSVSKLSTTLSRYI